MMLQASVPRIREAVRTALRAPGYHGVSPLERFLSWLGDELSRFLDWLFRPLRHLGTHRSVSWAVLIVLLVVLAALVALAAYQSWRRRDRSVAGLRLTTSGRAGRARDPWLAAQELAAGGNFTDAAHALYRALLELGARRGELRLHPSKTAGDYVRELRARSSRMLQRFREFARAYDTVIYGIGSCDRERYERLRTIALAIADADA